ncbi:MAG TPA: DJ-1/PfpI family protein [Thermoleophilaceae bacterium]|nr:DJ-1/PfpI family protein [Thermoleophilaceae bacterium]
MAPRRIVFAVFDGFQSLDLFGPVEVFSIASRLSPGAYATEVVAPGGRSARCSSGVSVAADGALTACRGPLDTLVVAGGNGMRDFAADARAMRSVGEIAGRARRTCSVCTGAYALAAAGLLAGRRATTHWSACRDLARRHPEVNVDPDAIFVRDGDVATSAGVTAGIDLALALVEEDLGPEVALAVARWLVLFVRRPGGQTQFSAHLSGGPAARESLRALQTWVVDNLDADLSVPALAERAFMSPRHFARAFKAEVGMTPAAYVEALRVERARLLLEAGRAAVDEVARQAGFGTVETFRRAFRRRVGVSPTAYREHFATERTSAA